MNRFALLFTLFATTICAVANAAEIEEVIVYAERRAENLQEVPIAVTAFSEEQIKEFRFERSNQIADQTANVLMIQSNFGLGTPVITIRGVTNADFAAQNSTPVVVYSDGVVLNQTEVQGFALFDVGHVEVLRGPQGSLFGRNATAGALQFLSAQPTEDTTGYADITLGNFDQVRFEGAISGALNENWTGRLAVMSNERDGFVDNTFLGTDLHEQDDLGIRAILEYQQGALTANLKLQYADASGTGLVFHNSIGDSSTTGSLVFLPTPNFTFIERGGDAEDYEIIQQDLPKTPEEVESNQATLTNTYDFDNLTLTSITGFLEHDYEEFNDDDASIFEIAHEHRKTEQSQFSQEFRLSGNTESTDWLLGLYYFEEDLETEGGFAFSDLTDATIDAFFNPFFEFFSLDATYGEFGTALAEIGGLPVPNTGMTSLTTSEQDTESLAIFGHAKFTLSSVWSATLGLRYSRDEKDFEQTTGGCFLYSRNDPFGYGKQENLVLLPGGGFSTVSFNTGFCTSTRTTFTGDDTWNDWSGNVSLEYTPSNETMIYVSVGRGFKGGNFSTSENLALGLRSFKPETIIAYEAGLRSTILGGRGTFNATAFYWDYKDFQAFDFVLDTSVNPPTIVFNQRTVDEAESYGAELELNTHLTDELFLSLGLGWLETEMKSDPFKGKEFRAAPRWNFNGQLSYTATVGNWYLIPQLDWVFVDDYFSSLDNSPLGEIDSYWKINFRTSLVSQDEKWAITAFVENLNDEVIVNNTIPSGFNEFSGNTDFATVEPPRLYGLRVSYQL